MLPVESRRYVQEKAKGEKPFFIYWATYTQQLQGHTHFINFVSWKPGCRRASGSTAQMKDPHVDKANAQASMMAAHSKYVTRLLETLQAVDASEKPRCV